MKGDHGPLGRRKGVEGDPDRIATGHRRPDPIGQIGRLDHDLARAAEHPGKARLTAPIEPDRLTDDDPVEPRRQLLGLEQACTASSASATLWQTRAASRIKRG